MKIVVKKVGQNPEIREIPNELHAMQEIVGGYIQAVMVTNDPIFCVCNEEGKLQELEPNFILNADIIVGDVFFVGANEEDFVGLTDYQAKWVMKVMTAVEENKVDVT